MRPVREYRILKKQVLFTGTSKKYRGEYLSTNTRVPAQHCYNVCLHVILI